MIKQSKIFEVYEQEGKRNSILTINLTPGKQVYDCVFLLL